MNHDFLKGVCDLMLKAFYMNNLFIHFKVKILTTVCSKERTTIHINIIEQTIWCPKITLFKI